MYQGKSLQDLAAELQRQSDSKRDFIVDSRNVTFSTQGLVEGKPTPSYLGFKTGASEEAFPLNDLAHQQLAERLHIPRPYYDRMRVDNPRLLDANVNAWFQQEPAGMMVRTLDGRGRAVLSNKYRPLDNMDVAERVLPIIGAMNRETGARVMSCELTERRMYIKVVHERVRMEVAVGDVVQSGIVISNSEVGSGAVKVEPLVFRLVCLNGMISADYSQKKYHVGRGFGLDADEATEVYRADTLTAINRTFLMKVEDTVRAVASQSRFEVIVKRMQEAKAKVINADPIKTVEVLQKREGLTEHEHHSVLTHLLSGGDLTQYGLMNAITRASQDVDNYDRATELERLGGKLLALPASEWNTLANVA